MTVSVCKVLARDLFVAKEPDAKQIATALEHAGINYADALRDIQALLDRAGAFGGRQAKATALSAMTLAQIALWARHAQKARGQQAEVVMRGNAMPRPTMAELR